MLVIANIYRVPRNGATMLSMRISQQSSQQPYKVGTITTAVSQARKQTEGKSP